MALAIAVALLSGIESAPSTPVVSDAAPTLGKLPLSFVPNKGQTNAAARYYARGTNFSFYFTQDRVVLDFAGKRNGVVLDLRFLGASANARIVAERPRGARVNYIGRHRSYTGLPTYGQIRYRDLWPGIDMVFWEGGGTLEYEFLVTPGADPSAIRLAYAGADSVSIDRAGALAVGTPLGSLTDAAPRSRAGGVSVSSRYVVVGDSFGFRLGSYDTGRALRIDPGLAYSTFLGGTSGDSITDGVVDSTGNAYVTGFGSSSDYPVTAVCTTPLRTVAAMSTSRSWRRTARSPIRDTWSAGDGIDLGGLDVGLGIAIDAQGDAYVMEYGVVLDFPTTPGAYRATFTEGQPVNFVAKLNPTGGSLLYSTFVGPGDTTTGSIGVDASGNAYISGGTFASDYPTTPGAYDTTFNGGRDVYLTKLNAIGSALAYSTYIGGGTTSDVARAITVDAGGSAYLLGDTGTIVGGSGGPYPTTPGAYDTTLSGQDVFVTKVNQSGSGLVYSTFLETPGVRAPGTSLSMPRATPMWMARPIPRDTRPRRVPMPH